MLDQETAKRAVVEEQLTLRNFAGIELQPFAAVPYSRVILNFILRGCASRHIYNTRFGNSVLSYSVELGEQLAQFNRLHNRQDFLVAVSNVFTRVQTRWGHAHWLVKQHHQVVLTKRLRKCFPQPSFFTLIQPASQTSALPL